MSWWALGEQGGDVGGGYGGKTQAWLASEGPGKAGEQG